MFATLLEGLDFLWKDVQNERIVVVMDFLDLCLITLQ